MKPIDLKLDSVGSTAGTAGLRRATLIEKFEEGDHYFESPSFSYLGKGTRSVKSVPQADLRSGSFDVSELIGPEASMAFVELPFDRQRPATVVTPDQELIEYKSPGNPVGWVNPITADDGYIGSLHMALSESSERSLIEIIEDQPDELWQDSVERATERLRGGEIQKVVLARSVTIRSSTDISHRRVLANLSETFPGTYLFAFDGLIGASPELLISCESGLVRSRPLAGTVGRSDDPIEDISALEALSSGEAFSREHLIVRDYVRGVLSQNLDNVTSSHDPYVLSLPNVHHLASEVRGRLRAEGPSVLQLAALLHPTPAVCGWPLQDAYQLISELEGWRRGTYAGAVGCIDRSGNGWFAVAIRCAKIDGRQATAFVGNGIVSESEPEAELAETKFKLRGVVGSIVGSLLP